MQLFRSAKEWAVFLLVAVALIGALLLKEHQRYKRFLAKPFFYSHATLQKIVPKKSYQLLKLKNEQLCFYISDNGGQNLTVGDRLRLRIVPSERISFRGFLGCFYIQGVVKESLHSPSFKQALAAKIASEHKNKTIAKLYNALFLALPITSELRAAISKWGVSHLIAISGFHLGLLWAVLYGGLSLLYRPLQKRYFPYRSRLLDVGSLVLLALGIYLLWLDSPPSLLRAYGMMLVGYILLLYGADLLSQMLLVMVVLLVIIVDVRLVVSLSFWLSVLGVASIYIVLNRWGGLNRYLVTIAILPIGIYLLMFPIVGRIFGEIGLLQPLSIGIELLFIPFYPLAILLHLVGCGGFFDTLLESMLSATYGVNRFYVGSSFMLFYGALFLGAFFFNRLTPLLLATAFIYWATCYYDLVVPFFQG